MTHSRRVMLAQLLALGVAACGGDAAPAPEAGLDMTTVKADLQMLARARVLFAHQSVGRNILAGVQQLAARAGVPLRVLEIDGLPPDDGPGLFHVNIGVNGEPETKLAGFTSLVTRSERPRYDVALLKFCYLDLAADAKDADGLAQRYLQRMSELRAQRPDVRFVYATAPLRADPPGWKTTLKRWLGRSTWEDADNARRNTYNTVIRERVGSQALFDIAGVESTLPDGSRSSFREGGREVFTLAQAYTTDGGHLNATGQLQAAARFLHVLAQTLARPPSVPG